jgi:hypothetical protein
MVVKVLFTDKAFDWGYVSYKKSHLFVQYRSSAASTIKAANRTNTPIANTITMVSIIALPLEMGVTWVQMGLYT